MYFQLLRYSILVAAPNICCTQLLAQRMSIYLFEVLATEPEFLDRIDNCVKDGVEGLTTILCGIEQISESNEFKFNATQSIMVKNSFYCTYAAYSSTEVYLTRLPQELRNQILRKYVLKDLT